jgi:hypothetical protein
VDKNIVEPVTAGFCPKGVTNARGGFAIEESWVVPKYAMMISFRRKLIHRE